MGDERVVVLVHGTCLSPVHWFTRHPCHRHGTWTQASSPFVGGLKARLQGRTIVRRVQWSGMNSFGGRRAAAERLRRKLARLSAVYPNARRFVIAHSHGGNVTLLALGANDAQRVDGVVCMATPFLHLGWRDLGPMTGPIARTLLAVTLVALGFAFLFGAASGIRSLPDSLLFGVIKILLTMILAGVTGLTLLVLFHDAPDGPSAVDLTPDHGKEWFRVSAARFLDRHALPSMAPSPLLSVRLPGDEPGAFLSLSYLIARGVSLAWNLCTRPLLWLSFLVRHPRVRAVAQSILWAAWIPLFLFGVSLFFILPIAQHVLPASVVDTVMMVSAVGMFLSGAVIMVFWLWGCLEYLVVFAWGLAMIVPALLLLTLSAAAYGLPWSAVSVMLEVMQDTNPPGGSVSRVVPDSVATPSGAALYHSRVYDNPAALDAIAAWISSLPEKREGA